MKKSPIYSKYVRQFSWGNLTMPGLLLLMWILFFLIEPRFATSTNLSNLLRQASILAIAAYAQTFVVITGGVDLSTGANAALTTMISALVAKEQGVIAGFACGLLTGTILGIINGTLVAYLRVPPFIATVGMFIYGRALAWYIGGGLPIELMPEGYEILGSGFIWGIPIPIIISLAILIPIHLILTHTQFGRYLYAIGGNENATRLSGISVQKYRLLAFVASGFLGGLTGIILSSRVNSGQPGIYPNLEFTAITAIAIGGVSIGGGEGNVFRALLGTIILATINNGMNLANLSSYYQQVAYGLILILAVIIDNVQRGKIKLSLLFIKDKLIKHPQERSTHEMG